MRRLRDTRQQPSRAGEAPALAAELSAALLQAARCDGQAAGAVTPVGVDPVHEAIGTLASVAWVGYEHPDVFAEELEGVREVIRGGAMKYIELTTPG